MKIGTIVVVFPCDYCAKTGQFSHLRLTWPPRLRAKFLREWGFQVKKIGHKADGKSKRNEKLANQSNRLNLEMVVDWLHSVMHYFNSLAKANRLAAIELKLIK